MAEPRSGDESEQTRAYRALEERFAERTHEIERRREVAEGLRDLLAVVNSRRTLDEVLDYIVDQARILLESEASAIFLPVPVVGEAEEELGIRASSRLEAEYLDVRMPIGRSSTGLAYSERRPIAVTNLRQALPPRSGPEQAIDLEERSSYLRVTKLPSAIGPREEDGTPQPYGGLPSFAARYGSFLAVPLAVKEMAYGTLSLYFSHPREFAEDEVSLATAFADQAALAIENARLREQAEQRTREIERRREVAEGLRDLLAVVNSHQTLDEILDHVVVQARRLLGGDASAIFFPSEESEGGDLLAIRASSGMDPTNEQARMPMRRSATGLAFVGRQPVAIPDLHAVLPVAFVERHGLEFEERRTFINVVRQPSKTSVSTDGQDAAQIQRLRSFASSYGALLAVPLAAKDVAYGTLSLYFWEAREFSEDEVALARVFADQAALAIENARLRSQAEQAAALEERQRLARELHDAVTQTLFSASLIAEVVPDLWDVDPAEARRRLEQLRRLTRGALAEMRILLVELRPGALTELSLRDLLRQLTEAVIGTTRTEVTLRVEGRRDTGLPPDVQVALYRIAQEGLNNVAKHAQASCAEVTLLYEADGGVTLRIRDDGQGFDPAAIPAGHLGVGIMHERAAAIGAHLGVESGLGTGTQVEVTWREAEREGAET